MDLDLEEWPKINDFYKGVQLRAHRYNPLDVMLLGPYGYIKFEPGSKYTCYITARTRMLATSDFQDWVLDEQVVRIGKQHLEEFMKIIGAARAKNSTTKKQYVEDVQTPKISPSNSLKLLEKNDHRRGS